MPFRCRRSADFARLCVCANNNDGAQPRTLDGQPDFQGYWTNLTYTPFERPKELGTRAFYTEQEATEAFNKAVAGFENQEVHYVSIFNRRLRSDVKSGTEHRYRPTH